MSKDQQQAIKSSGATENKKRSLNFSKPGRRVVKRKQGETKPSANYFTIETQKSIVCYQDEEEIGKKEKIYVEEILPAFSSLVENLINVYGFKVMHETKADLKDECLEFLFSTVNKYDVTKGSKAFSYFNVVAKNWLTIKSKQNVKRMKTYISSDHKEDFSNEDLETYEMFNVVPSYEDIIEKAEFSKNLKLIMKELGERAKTENELLVVNAITQIVENLDDIDILNKRAVLLYVREITGLSSKQLSSAMSVLKKHYKDVKKIVVE